MNFTMIASIKGKNASGYFVKLIKYTVTGNTFIADFYFVNKPTVCIVNSGIKVGIPGALQSCYPSVEDAVDDIQCQSGIASQPTRMSGTFSTSPDGTTYIFTYGSSFESWTCIDGDRYVLTDLNYSVNTPYGWAFKSDIAGSLNFYGTFYGEFQRYNGWNNIEEPVRSDTFQLITLVGTTTGAMRRVEWDVNARCWVHSYFARIGDLAIYQTSHDFNNDGRIVAEKGHTYFGYPIIQCGQHRGFVFADASEAPPEGTFSAMYYWG